MIEALQLNAREENYKYLKTIMPTFESGARKGQINWKESIGIRVSYFICVGKGEFKQEYKGELTIRDYKDTKLYFEGIEKGIYHSSFVKGTITGILNIKYRLPDLPKFKVGDTIKNKNRDLTIIDRKHVSNGEITPNGNISKNTNWWYKLKCNKDGYEHWKISTDLKKFGCPCCANQTPVLRINTIWETHRYLVTDFGLDKEFAKTHTAGTSEKGKFICPNCGKILFKRIPNVIKNKSISCICGDGISYPEKLGCGVFRQLSYEFETQYSPNYFDKERSDFYFPDLKLVVEFDGKLGHEGGVVHSKSKKTLEECIAVDNWKTEQHKKHRIKTIRINCFESDLEYIKNNILESELVNYFDFSNIDWLKAEEYALKNINKEVCSYWYEHKEIKQENITASTTIGIFHISRSCVIKYLKNGTKLGWCHYDPKEEMARSAKRSREHLKKIYIVIFPDGTIYKSESRKTMADYLGVGKTFVSNNSDGKPYKAFYKKNERLNGIRLFTKELFIKKFGEEEFNKL